MTNNKYNAHTEPLFKDLKSLRLDVMFDIQCNNFFYKFTNNTLPEYFRSLFRHNRDIFEIETRNHNTLLLFSTRTHSAEHVLVAPYPKTELPCYITDWVRTRSIQAFSSHLNNTLWILILPFVLIQSTMFVTIRNVYNCTRHTYVFNHLSLKKYIFFVIVDVDLYVPT